MGRTMTAFVGQHHIRIRPAAADDCDAIAAVLVAAFAEYAPLYTPAGLAATTPASDTIRNRLGEGPIWVAERKEDSQIVGTVAAVARAHGLYIRSMAVLPSARGQQIGEALIAQVERFAAAQGHTRLFLSTTPFLVRAIRLYERLGFQQSDDGPHELFGTPLVTMVKILAT
jgi:ribosomal protein S18 acetylase RimI-like enzyme